MAVTCTGAFADPIPAGNDSFTAKAASVDISIPPDFFNPGSDPFSGSVLLGSGSGGGVDAIVQRTDPASPLPVPGTDTIPIELVQLHLQSVQPFDVTYGGTSTEQWAIDVVLDTSTPSPGSMVIQHPTPDGGTFDSFFDVFFEVDFSPILPGSTIRSLFLEDTIGGNCTWTHIPPVGFPDGLHFYPGGVPGNPNQLNHLFLSGGKLNLELSFIPDIPEPSTLVLLVSGLAVIGLLLLCRRR